MAIGKWTHPNLEDYLEEPMNEIRMCVAEWMKAYTHGVKEGGKEHPHLQSLAQERDFDIIIQGAKVVHLLRQALGAMMVLDEMVDEEMVDEEK